MAQEEELRRNGLLTSVCTFPGVFSPEECSRMIALKEKAYKRESSRVADHGEDRKDIRNSINNYIAYDPESEWAYNRVIDGLKQYNQRMQFHLSRFEPLLVLEYQKDAFYTWHIDLGNETFSTRKISLVLLLSDPAEFEGGELEFMVSDTPFQAKLNQGDAALFPSFLLHRVLPVTAGLRHSLVCWAHGHAFM